MMIEFAELVGQVFARRGFTVAQSDGSTLAVTLDHEQRLVHWKTEGPVTVEDVHTFGAIAKQNGFRGGVLLALAGHADNAVPAAARVGIDLWTAAHVAVEVGEAVIASFAAEPVPPAPSAAPASAPEAPVAPAAAMPGPSITVDPPAAHAPRKFQSLVAQAAGAASQGGDTYFYKSTKKTEAAPAAGKPLAYAWGASAAALTSPTPSGIAQVRKGKPRAAEASAAPAVPLQVAPDDVEITVTKKHKAVPEAPAAAAAPAGGNDLWNKLGHMKAPAPAAPVAATPAAATVAPTPASWTMPAPAKTLMPALDRDAAAQVAASKVGGATAIRLSLVPCITFKFDTHVENELLDAPLEGHGAVLVDAITGKLREVPVVATTTAIPEAAETGQAKLEAVDIYDKVKGHLLKRFTKEVQVTKEIGGVEVSETKRIGPSIDDLGLDHKGVMFAPVWIVSGPNGVANVDAMTGAILE